MLFGQNALGERRFRVGVAHGNGCLQDNRPSVEAFVHDPLWNRRLFSLQAARDGEIWFWKATRIFVGFSGLSV